MTTGTEFPGLTAAQVNALIAVYAAPIEHEHDADAITSGTLDAARLPDLSTTYASANTAFVTDTTTTVWLSGGLDNYREYDVRNRIVTAGGRTLDQVIIIKTGSRR